jgi:photosystem II stability/assembly factor-like uncharacterized protein
MTLGVRLMRYWQLLFVLCIGLLSNARAQWVQVSNGLAANGNPRLSSTAVRGSSVYALSTSKGVFKSDDGGSSWRLLGRITGVLGLAVDPNSPSTAYAGTRHGVRKSIDGGETWTAASLPGKVVSVIAVHPQTSSTVFAASGSTIYRSTDSGTTWTPLSLQFQSQFGAVSTILVDPGNPSLMYVVGEGSPLYKSTDAGETWTVINSGHFSAWLQLAASNPGVLYAIRWETGLARSADGGVTWTSIEFGQPAQLIAVAPSNPSILYAAIAGPALTGQAIYKSTNGGTSWFPVNTAMPIAASLSVDPANSSIVFAVSYNGNLFRSVDGGVTFNDAGAAMRVYDIQVLSRDPANPGTVYAGGEGSLSKSTDGGATWQSQHAFQFGMAVPPPGLPAPPAPVLGAGPAIVRSLAIDSNNPATLYVGAHRSDGCFFADQDFFKSTDGGATWNSSGFPANTGCQTDGTLIMDPTNPATIYLPLGDAYDSGFWMSKSIDGGATWNNTGLFANNLLSVAIDPINSRNLYAATDAGVVRSMDAGDHWSITGLTQADVNLLAIDPVRPQVIYAATATGLRKTTDSGATWSAIGNGIDSVTAIVIDPARSNDVYFATAGAGVFKSSNGGVNLAPFNDGLTQLDVQSLAILPADSGTLFAGTPGGIFKLVEGRSIKHTAR